MAALIPALSEDDVESMLKECLGRIDIAAHRLAIPMPQLDAMIRKSERLQTVFLTCQKVVGESSFERDSLASIEAEINRRLVFYRSEAIDEIRSLAVMPISESANNNHIKLLAATKLAGGTVDRTQGSSLEETLASLDREYHQKSPRIKEIRERVVTFENEPKVIESQ